MIPEPDEITEFRDRNSTETSLATAPMKVYTVLNKYLHSLSPWPVTCEWFHLFCLYFGCKKLSATFSLVSEARLCKFLSQSQAIDFIINEVELFGNYGSTILIY